MFFIIKLYNILCLVVNSKHKKREVFLTSPAAPKSVLHYQRPVRRTPPDLYGYIITQSYLKRHIKI